MTDPTPSTPPKIPPTASLFAKNRSISELTRSRSWNWVSRVVKNSELRKSSA